VVVDHLTKQPIFILTYQTIDVPTLAKLFITYVFSKHGVPSHVTLDQGSEFVSRFFCSLAAALDMRLHFTSGYHPKGDGQTKQTNQTLEQYLRIYCNYQQSNWSHLLPLAEFMYNNTTSVTTGISPFFTNKEYHPKLQAQPNLNLPSESICPFIVELDMVHVRLKQSIAEAQACYQGPADAKYSILPDIKIGDQVFILARNIQTTQPSKKLSECYLGPFTVTGKPGSHLYQIRLPEHM